MKRLLIVICLVTTSFFVQGQENDTLIMNKDHLSLEKTFKKFEDVLKCAQTNNLLIVYVLDDENLDTEINEENYSGYLLFQVPQDRVISSYRMIWWTDSLFQDQVGIIVEGLGTIAER